MKHLKHLTFSAILVSAALTQAALAQTSNPAGPTKALSHAIHAVEDLDTTLAFYHDVFGLNSKAQDFANPAVPLLTNAPGVTLRMTMMSLPGVRFELTHFKGLERKGARAAYTDPGAGSLVFYVRDIDEAVANAKKANAPIVTTGGAPVEISIPTGKARSIIIRDPDGFFLQLIQAQGTPAADAPAGNVQRVTLAYTMESAEATKKFYTGQLGIALDGPAKYSQDASYLKLVGAPEGTEFRKISGVLPGAKQSVPIEFTEFKGLPRTKFHLRVRDPGAPALCVQVFDEKQTIGQMKAAGVPVLSKDGEIVDFGGGTFTIFVTDPNGMNLEVFERNPPQAKQSAQNGQSK